MDAVLTFLSTPLGIALAVLVVVAITALVVFALRSRPSAPEPQAAPVAHPERGAKEPLESAEIGESPARAGPGEAAGDGAGEEWAAVEAPAEAEVPESVPSRLQRLRSRLAGTGSLGRAIVEILARGDLKATDWEEIEDTLLVADLGLEATDELISSLRSRVAVAGTSDPARIRSLLAEELLALVGPDMDRSLHLDRGAGAEDHPASVLVVGVNGTGKTTTVGKLARVLLAEGRSVLLGAADTFRAAAADQLQTWGDRVGVEVVRSDREGADPASVAFDAVKEGAARGVDVVLVDTAGRLQNKLTLMDELSKVKRVMEKRAPLAEVLLVLDATTGQNGLKQAEVFAEAAGVTGIVLTKLDGSAKGGIVVSVQRALGVPVKFVGLGEGPDDLAPFDPQGFVDSIIKG
ncbi:signal recognition particle-docking protein FtsY [Schaalia hyovaginalis]|uniref:Signal recognition particle receptor FtsY n=1 Tax=Schaalia hyovaginalis TaxID=29316 RepID=A0A923IZK3_9ACTO|nr:signal recognition particle-docking protein FtsY [Schaalia hyovaginalis]MBB6334834.1 fused signal recognition particle receptor [Schaalia hyovaginalis]MDY2668234.1 signal recognition particle-docking protein FtsY [Schaalia hyovaginalis]